MARRILHATELDRSSLPAFRDRVLMHADHVGPVEMRSYPGGAYPRFQLERVRPRPLVRLDHALASRRSARTLGLRLPSKRDLSRLLWLSHGAVDALGRGPTPSAGGIQALELYMLNLDSAWLPRGVFHYDRAGHALSLVREAGGRTAWDEHIPSLVHVEGGAAIFIVTAELPRIEEKYGRRAARFALIEAGHLMQNLCIVAASLRHSVVPLGGITEAAIAADMGLPRDDVVLYGGVLGSV